MALNEKEKAQFFEAAEKNNLTAVKYFVEEELASLQLINENFETMAHIAARNGYTDLLKYVLKKEPSIAAEKDDVGNTPFFLANQVGAIDIIRYMYEQHGEEVTRDRGRKFLSFALHTAVQNGHLDTLKYFLEEKRCDVNTLNERQESLLYAAVEYGHDRIVKYLVEKRQADVMLLNKNRANVIFPTVATDNLPLIRYFFDERQVPINVNAQDKFNNTLVHRAAFMNRTRIMRYLVKEKHANIQIHGDEGRTPLHYAASRNCFEICTILVDHGANLWAKDENGRIPAQSTFDKGIIAYLKGASLTTLRPRRCVHPISEYNLPNRQNPQATTLLTASSEVSAPSFFDNFYSSRLHDFLAIAEFIARSTRHFSSQSNGYTFPTPSQIVREKMDPIAVDAVTAVHYFEE